MPRIGFKMGSLVSNEVALLEKGSVSKLSVVCLRS